MIPNDQAIADIRASIERRRRIRTRLVEAGQIVALTVALGIVAGMLFGCATYTGMPCSACVGPYDLTLSSHREALLGD